jgi:hypothetical protein
VGYSAKNFKNRQKAVFSDSINPIWVYCTVSESSPQHAVHPLGDDVIGLLHDAV